MMNRVIKVSCLVGLAGTAACTETPTTSLAELQTKFGDTTLEMVSLGQINVLLKTASTECPKISDEVEATFDGLPMAVSRGGYDNVADGCYPIAFWVPAMPLPTIQAYEATNASSDLVIKDSSAAWTVASTRMFSNNFVVDTANALITWQDVSSISTVQLTPAAPTTIAGNVIHFPAGAEVDAVSAYAHPTPSKCDGPQECTVDLQGARTFRTDPQQ